MTHFDGPINVDRLKLDYMNKIYIVKHGVFSWGSHGDIYRAQMSTFKKIWANNIKLVTVDNFQHLSFSCNDVVIFPVGTFNDEVLSKLASAAVLHTKNRPRMIFFPTAEGAKIGYHFYKYYKCFTNNDVFVVASDVEQGILKTYLGKNANIIRINYPLMEEKNIFSKSECRRKLNLSRDKKYVLYAGRLSLQKNILSLISFLEKNPDLNLIVCGKNCSIGKVHFKNDLSQINVHAIFSLLIKNRNLQNRITFLGFVSQKKLAMIFSAVDGQISLSTYYGEEFGYSIAQGMQRGLPTIISSWGGHLNWKNYSRVKMSKVTWNKAKDQFAPEIQKISLATIKMKKGKNFKNYHADISKSYNEMLFLKKREHRVFSIRKKILNFWQNHHEQYLFEDAKNSHYQLVVKKYLGN